MEGKNSAEQRLMKGMAKRARDFFHSLADTIKIYLAEESEEVKEITAPKKSSAKKSPRKIKKTKSKKTAKKMKTVKKPQRDPNAPKKPLPAFLLYSNTRRKEMKEEGASKLSKYVDLALKERLDKIKKEWTMMSKGEKDV